MKRSLKEVNAYPTTCPPHMSAAHELLTGAEAFVTRRKLRQDQGIELAYYPLRLQRGLEDTMWGYVGLTVLVDKDGYFKYRLTRDSTLIGDEVTREEALSLLAESIEKDLVT